MKPSLTKRLDALEEAADIAPRTHFVWTEAEGDDIEGEIAARIAGGTARVGDRFLTISWRAWDLRFPSGQLG